MPAESEIAFASSTRFLSRTVYDQVFGEDLPPTSLPAQQTQNICITFVQCWTNVEDVGPTLYKCYTNVLSLLGDSPCIRNF